MSERIPATANHMPSAAHEPAHWTEPLTTRDAAHVLGFSERTADVAVALRHDLV